MELCQGMVRWGLGKGSAPEGGGHGTDSGHGLEVLEFKRCLDNALRYRI